MSNYQSGPDNLQDGLNLAQEWQIEGAVREVRRISEAPLADDEGLDQRIHVARTAIAIFDSTGFVQMPDRTEDRTFVISALQRLAYHDADSGIVADIAEWCMNQWLVLLQRHAQDLDALRGLGQAWLARSQNVLARIHRAEGSSSSGSSGRPQSLGERLSYSSTEEAREAERAVAEADARAHTADYVEARGMLIPAVDYFANAVEIAEREGRIAGELLAEAAEANMSLGNVSYSHQNEQYFHRAIRYLRRASQIPGYRLSPYLQSYLDDYGRLVD